MPQGCGFGTAGLKAVQLRFRPRHIARASVGYDLEMRIRQFLMLVLALASARAEDLKPVFPRADWEHVAAAEVAGFSSAKLEVLRAWMKTQHTTAMMVSVGGRVLFEYVDVTHVSVLASARKSVLVTLFGQYLCNDEPAATE